MRKDLKLGLAVGGVLFGVVLAYVLVFSGGNPENQQASNTADPTNPVIPDAAADAAQQPIIQTETPAPSSPVSAVAEAASSPRAAGNDADRRMEVSVGGTTPRENTTAANNTTGNASAETTGALTTQPAVANPGPWDWRRALEQGASIPTAAAHGQSAGTSQAIAAASSTSVIPFNPTTQPSAGKRNYIVKSGESFWSIAQREYGNANYLSHIARANPNINASRLKAGMTIVLPAREDVIPSGAPAAASAIAQSPAAPIDPAKEYRVQSGDNLTLIAKRLYGRASRAADLYELNKGLIGPNPSALKKNMVLKLPDAPTAAGTAENAAGAGGIAGTTVQ